MRSVFVFLATAAPALAHSGAHLHPHDGGPWLAVAGGLAAIAAAVLVWRRK